jgi:PAS domain S-box-containing protein
MKTLFCTNLIAATENKGRGNTAEVSLQECEERYRMLFTQMADASFLLENGIFIDCNAAALQLFGAERADIIGSNPASWSPESQADGAPSLAKTSSLIEQALRNGSIRFEWTHRRSDGAALEVEVMLTKIGLDRRPLLHALVRDITDRKLAAHAVADNEYRYRTIFEAASDCILVISPEGRLLDFNHQACAVLGYDREELLGQAFSRILNAHTLTRLFPRPAHVLRERRSARGEESIRSKDGRRHCVEYVVNPLPGGNVLAIIRDVSEHKRTERLLIDIGRSISSEMGEAFFRQLILRLCSHLEADYAFIGEIVHPDGACVRTRTFVADGKEATNFEYELKHSACMNAVNAGAAVAYPDHAADRFPDDARLRRLAVQGYIGVPLTAADGSRLGVLAIMSRRPIRKVQLWSSILEIFATRAIAEIERTRAEAQLRQLNAGLEDRVRRRTLALDLANQELESFSYMVSHDLRAPLRAISGYAELLRSDHSSAIDSEGREFLQRIKANAARMNELIVKLLEMSRAARGELKAAPVNMRELVDAVLVERRELLDKGAEISIGNLPDVPGDCALLRQVWQNLIENAFKYSRYATPAQITIGGSLANGKVEYFVRDNGIGFDMGCANKLFGAFQRLHSAGEFEGTGVGLAIVKRIVQRHGGGVDAEGAVGRGVVFRFTLPVAAEAQDTERTSTAPAADAEVAGESTCGNPGNYRRSIMNEKGGMT